MADKLNQEKTIDWEQRRYEIAKQVFCDRVKSGNNMTADMDASRAIVLADALISKLKK